MLIVYNKLIIYYMNFGFEDVDLEKIIYVEVHLACVGLLLGQLTNK